MFRFEKIALVAVLGAMLLPAAAAADKPGDLYRYVVTTQTLPGDTAVPFWPHETGVLVGTAETYADMRDDGSYYDASVGRRVFHVG